MPGKVNAHDGKALIVQMLPQQAHVTYRAGKAMNQQHTVLIPLEKEGLCLRC